MLKFTLFMSAWTKMENFYRFGALFLLIIKVKWIKVSTLGNVEYECSIICLGRIFCRICWFVLCSFKTTMIEYYLNFFHHAKVSSILLDVLLILGLQSADNVDHQGLK